MLIILMKRLEGLVAHPIGRWLTAHCILGAAGLLVALTGCGGGGSDSSVAVVDTTIVGTVVNGGTTTSTVTVGPSTDVAAVLTLDLANLPNYALTALPAFYDGGVAALDNTPAANPATNAGATLGRVLFYDRNLSVNNAVSCASCHQQALGFSDSLRFSVGFSGTAFTTAHSMRLGNLRYSQPGSMFWDRRAASVEAQATQPIQHPIEMGFDASNGGLAALFTKMQALQYYPQLFALAYGDSAITEARIQRALAQFQRAMVSTGSRWDRGYALNYSPALPDRGLSLPIASFTPQENRGRHLFITGPDQGGLACAACHVPPTFALAANSRSNGLGPGETAIFKSPSLKNVGLSGSFMHDGRLPSLEQVVEHYDSGVQAGPALDNRLRGPNGVPRVLNLSADDKAALVAFLRTLTDNTLIVDTRFSSPFKP